MSGKRITVIGMMELLSDWGEILLPPKSKWDAWRKTRGYNPIKSLEHYFPSSVKRTSERLLKEGYARVTEKSEGGVLTITEHGKHKLLINELNKVSVKTGIWDGKWRMVFFDVEEVFKNKRNYLRRYLTKLGLKQVQESVWVSPFDILDEIKFIRDSLEISHVVKVALITEIEDEEDLIKWFDL